MIRLGAISLAGILIAGASHAAPDVRAIAEGLDNAVGGDGTPPGAVTIERCEAVPGQPGYDCTFSVSECFDGDTRIADCDDPGYSQRALFVGGDNGWLALDIQYDGETAPRVPIDPSSPIMSDTTEYWMAGNWNPESNCENDAGFSLTPDGRYYSAGAAGRWSLEDGELTITVTEQAPGGEGTSLEPLDPPQIIRWTVTRHGPNVGGIDYGEGGEYGSIIRC